MAGCEHIQEAREFHVEERVCLECIKMGDRWVHLRMCLICGQVGCCDSSKNKHATKHYQATTHAVMRSIEPGEAWAWCYVDEIAYDITYGLKKARVAE